MSERSTLTASQEFAAWLDSVCTPVNMDTPTVDPERDYPLERFVKQEGYRHKYLMQHSFWYRNNVLEEQRLEGLRMQAIAKGKVFQEPTQPQLGEDGFWTQF